MLALAEVPHRLVEARGFDTAYAFDAQLCLQRLGSVLGQQSAAAQVRRANMVSGGGVLVCVCGVWWGQIWSPPLLPYTHPPTPGGR